ncbi:MAG: primosomal protein N', partial [Anaerolineales bacterium]|nr:primosomal protein N' [Anaerolineales bacterium]
DTRPVLSLLDPQVTLTGLQIALAEKISHETLTPLAACIDVMLPPGLTQQADTLYSLAPHHQPLSGAPLTSLQQRILAHLKTSGPSRGRQLDAAFRHVDWRASIRRLVRQSWVVTRSVLPSPTVQPKTARTARLACTPEQAQAAMPALGRAGSPAIARRQAILAILLREQAAVDAAWLYAESGGNLSDLRALEERSLITLGQAETWRDPLADFDFVPDQPPPLTVEQQEIWSIIQRGMQAAATGKAISPYLLHGVTGSGKTEIYLAAVQQVIEMGHQAIILVPEIALTPQTVRRFVSRFPGQVGILHSRLSPGERYDTWRRARMGEMSVVVGPRSALFTPFTSLGLIVVDEFHDDSYYQSETQPHYHASQAATWCAELAGAVCVLGSATPDVVSRYQAQQGKWHYLQLPKRILAHRQAILAHTQRLGKPSHYHPAGEQAETIELPPVQVVDMRQELKDGNRSIFSRALQEELKRVLDQQEQAILFLNRRGSATYVFCRDCGYTLRCPRCELPLTVHTGPSANQNILKCHYCNYQRQVPKTCPQCRSPRIRQYGTGTERVEAEVQSLFPQARTLRWDYDTTRQKDAHQVILNHFANRRADILIGTQMIAKGLDLPLVTLVGVVLADVGLSLPDLRAAERTFQVLTQVAGRAGRSLLGGKAILQTFQPDHYVIQAASRHDYQAFYTQELELRRQTGYPPFARLVRLEFRHARADQAEAEANRLSAQLRTWLEEQGLRQTHIIGPAPCFFTRLGGAYRWQIVLRGPDPAALLRGRALGAWRIEVNPPSLL